MSAHGPDSNKKLHIALLKTLALAAIAWGILATGSILYIIMAQVAGAGWKDYDLYDHANKFACPGFKVWMVSFFAMNKFTDGTKRWWVAWGVVTLLTLPMALYLLQEAPFGGGGLFIFRHLPQFVLGDFGLGVAESLFPNPDDIRPPPHP